MLKAIPNKAMNYSLNVTIDISNKQVRRSVFTEQNERVNLYRITFSFKKLLGGAQLNF